MSYLLHSRLGCRKLFSINNNELFKRLYAAKKKEVVRKIPAGCIQNIYQRPYETHDDKNRRLKRPLVGCLTVFSMQICSLCSITHRITGIVGSAYLFLFASHALLATNDLNCACQYIECMQLPAVLLAMFKFGLGFPYIYHSLNGIRHLTWDTGKLLELKTVNTTGIITMAFAALATVGAIFAF